MWEARHGFPRAERLPSGHRRYPQRGGRARARGGARARRRPVAGGGRGAIRRRTPRGPRDLDLRRACAAAAPSCSPTPSPSGCSWPCPTRSRTSARRAASGPSCWAPSSASGSTGRPSRAGASSPARRNSRSRWPTSSGRPRRRTARSRCRSSATTRWRASGPSSATRPGFAACLAGRERQVTGERIFEMLWSVEPEVVRDAALIGLDLAKARRARDRRARARAPVTAAGPGRGRRLHAPRR